MGRHPPTPRERRLRRLRGLVGTGLMAGLLLAGARCPAQANSPDVVEHGIKAAYLYNFTKLVEWPTNRFATAQSPLVIGVVGTDSTGETIEKVVAGKSVNGRSFTVIHLAPGQSLNQCHLLFVSRSAKVEAVELLSSLKSESILTVGEVEGFAQRGGIINFYLEDDSVKCEVNPAAAERAGLRISSKLLRVARLVKSRPIPP